MNCTLSALGIGVDTSQYPVFQHILNLRFRNLARSHLIGGMDSQLSCAPTSSYTPPHLCRTTTWT